MTPVIGSLFSGYAGLDMGVQSVLGGTVAWHSEIEAAPSRILDHHYPDVPNLGDITAVDWSTVEPVDVLTGGYPCQPFSHAGKRDGTNDDRHLWPYVAQAIAAMRPGLCVFENVRGHLSLGFDEVLRDLQQLGYSVTWYLLRAADVGAAHGRARLFIFAKDSNEHRVCGRTHRRRGVDRDHEPIAGGHLRDQPQGQHVGQGEACVGCAGWTVRGQGHCGRGFDGHSPQHLSVAADREGCGVCAQGAGGVPDYQGEAVSDRPGTRSDGRGRTDRQGGRQEVEPGDERACSDAAVAHQEGEPARPGPDSANPAELEADSGLQPRMVVGAGRRPVRSGGVRGPAAGVRSDGCWACVRDALMAGASRAGRAGAPFVPDAGGLGGIEAIQHDGRGTQVRDGAGLPDQPDRPDRDVTLLPTPRSSDTNGPGVHGSGGPDLRTAVSLLPTPMVGSTSPASHGQISGDYRARMDDALARWGDYAPAIARWEALTRPAPEPTETGVSGKPRLSPRFVEWLMGLPEGWVTDTPGVTRSQALKALGNGVVPAQSAAATRAWVNDVRAEQ